MDWVNDRHEYLRVEFLWVLLWFQIRMFADPGAAFTKAVDLTTDLPPLGGIRSKRYSMVVEDSIVKSVNVEPDGTGLTCSLAEKINLDV